MEKNSDNGDVVCRYVRAMTGTAAAQKHCYPVTSSVVMSTSAAPTSFLFEVIHMFNLSNRCTCIGNLETEAERFLRLVLVSNSPENIWGQELGFLILLRIFRPN